MNSTPLMPASIIRLTALPPPPPTPITLMRAPVIGGSSINIFIPLVFIYLLTVQNKKPFKQGNPTRLMFVVMPGIWFARSNYILCTRENSIQRLGVKIQLSRNNYLNFPRKFSNHSATLRDGERVTAFDSRTCSRIDVNASPHATAHA